MEKKSKFKDINSTTKELLEDYYIEINSYTLKIPKGFKFDGVSAPLVLRPFFPKFGKYTEAALAHDFLYSKENKTGINREWADKIFLFLLKKCTTTRADKMFIAVRVFGSIFWKKKFENEGYCKQAIIDKTDEAKKYNQKMQEMLGKL